MKVILDIVARHKRGEAVGITSVCSAHPLVIAATFDHARRRDAPVVLIEATSNQVNQDGGYTGMVPSAFRDFVYAIADKTGYARDKVALGGDHLGPNAWSALPADDAMAKAEVMIDHYVRAGFRKIHLDCSMSCADDPIPLADEAIAERAARLCAVAENAYAASGGEPPVYVIGTEVPVPGGAAEDLAVLEVTTPDAAQATISLHRRIFEARGLAAAWPRVIAAVVQPGVEFDHHKVIDYDRSRATALSQSISNDPQFVFEAHSTDYQSASALSSLVEDHFAILKVGPGVTFALREALWGLSCVEQELVPLADQSNFRPVVLERMLKVPKHWWKYYEGTGAALELDLQYSLSDRIRYYWPDPVIAAAQAQLFGNLDRLAIPLPLISQFLPFAYAAARRGEAVLNSKGLVMAHIAAVLDDYYKACTAHA